VSGQRAELLRTKAAIVRVDADISRQRDGMIDELVAKLEFAGIPIKTEVDAWLDNKIALQDGGWLVYGEVGAVLHFDAAGVLLEPVVIGSNRTLINHVALQGGGWLVYGEDGAVLRFDARGALEEPVATGINSWLIGHIALEGGGWLVNGTGDAVLRLNAGGALEKSVATGINIRLINHIALQGGGWLVLIAAPSLPKTNQPPLLTMAPISRRSVQPICP